jgi:hypothetical protein
VPGQAPAATKTSLHSNRVRLAAPAPAARPIEGRKHQGGLACPALLGQASQRKTCDRRNPGGALGRGREERSQKEGVAWPVRLVQHSAASAGHLSLQTATLCSLQHLGRCSTGRLQVGARVGISPTHMCTTHIHSRLHSQPWQRSAGRKAGPRPPVWVEPARPRLVPLLHHPLRQPRPGALAGEGACQVPILGQHLLELRIALLPGPLLWLKVKSAVMGGVRGEGSA